jgi:hypothetical protein
MALGRSHQHLAFGVRLMNAPQNSKCLICGADARQGPDWALQDFECLRCGTYKFDSTVGWLEINSPEHMVRLSGWVREQNAAGVVPNITPDTSRRVAATPRPRYRERAHKVLKIIAEQFGDLDIWYDPQEILSGPELLGTSYSADASEASELLEILKFDGFIDSPHGLIRISVPGLLAIEDMSAPTAASAQGFVAMDFADSMRQAWADGFDPAIRAAGFRPLRIDSKEYVGGITDEIMSEIRRSRFIVADYTGQKSGVYFEAGFALGLGLTIIPTCQANEIDNLHFDIRHLNTLTWVTPEDLAKTLSNRIRAVVGAGPNAPLL